MNELWQYLRVHKRWWLTPIIVVALAIAAIILFGQLSGAPPHLYTVY